MCDRVGGLGAVQFVPGSGYFGAGAHRGGIRSGQVVSHFGNLQDCQQLPLVHTVAYVDIDFLDVSGDFRHHIDFLVRLEFSGQHQSVGQIFGGRPGDGNGRDFGGFAATRLHGLAPRAGGVQVKCHEDE